MQEIRDLRNQGIHYRPSCLDSRRATAPRRYSITAVCSRYRIQPQRPADVGKIASTQMETRSSDGPPSAKSSHDVGSGEWLLAGLIEDRALNDWVGASLSMEVAMTTTQTQGQTPPNRTTMITTTSPLSPVDHLHHCSFQASSRPCSLRSSCSLLFL